MESHALIALANDRAVRQAKGFREAAASLTGAALAEKYEQQVRAAPRRHAAGQKYLVGPAGKRRAGPRARRQEEQLALALLAHCRETEQGLALPEAGRVDLLDHWVPLRAGASDRQAGEAGGPGADPADKRIGRIDLFGIAAGDRMAVVQLRFVAPEARRTAPGDTPLRVLLEGLAHCAIAAANRDALRAEVAEHFERSLSDQPPVLLVIGNPRYWELCRKREAQKGAAWIAQLERLASEIEASLGVSVWLLGLELTGEPAWEERDGRPRLTSPPQLGAAWEAGAGRVRPKPRPKLAAAAPEPIVQADPTRPVRSYALTGSYSAGDSIVHPTLGTGVVQGRVGPGKIRVLFDGKPCLLVHERPSPG